MSGVKIVGPVEQKPGLSGATQASVAPRSDQSVRPQGGQTEVRPDRGQANVVLPPAAPAPAAGGELTVRFVGRYRTYHRGDVAGFPRAFAEELIRSRVAVEARAAVGPPLIRK